MHCFNESNSEQRAFKWPLSPPSRIKVGTTGWGEEGCWLIGRYCLKKEHSEYIGLKYILNMFEWKIIWNVLKRRHALITMICQFFGPPGNCSISESRVLLIAALLKRPWILFYFEKLCHYHLGFTQNHGKHPGAGNEATTKG